MLQLSTMQRHGSHRSLNVHDVYSENVKTNITLHMVGGCESTSDEGWPWLVLLSWREKKYTLCVVGDTRWTVMLLII